MGKEKKLLFSVTKNDLEIQTFCTGGNGGQHRNAKQNGVRIIHRDSGAVAEHRDGRDQGQNREAAFRKLVESPVFKAWHKTEVARRLGAEKRAKEIVEASLANPNNVRVEIKNEEGKWQGLKI